MKFERNMSFSAEEFSDGEVLLYDDVPEVYHILNSTAAHALTILDKYGYEESKKIMLNGQSKHLVIYRMNPLKKIMICNE